MKFIKKSSVDEVLEDARIYDVVAACVGVDNVKKKGVNYFCCSPWTNEKTPSLCIKPVDNYFFDNSAGFGGNAIKFLEKYENISFYEAIEKAASICGITLYYEEQSEDLKRLQDEENEMKKVVQFASEQYQKAFHKLPAEHWAKAMVAEERGYTDDTIQTFMLGYAPDEAKFISSPVISMAKYDYGLSLGLFNTKDGSSYDFFRNRLMFPIQNDKGTVIGFGGRAANPVEGEERKYAKYLNSKESKLYLKTKVLYGYFQAKKKIAEIKKAVLVEGYTDVISLHQAGVNYAVAPCGTALTESQVKMIARVAKYVTVFMDGDAAGQRAVLKDINMLLAGGLVVLVCICPEGEDPDSMTRLCNVEEFLDKNSVDAVVWKAQQMKLQAKNPDLDAATESLRQDYEKQIEKLRSNMHLDKSFEDKNLSPTDKKFMKKENDRLFNEISELERDLNDTVKDLPQFDPVKLSDAIEEMAVTLQMISDSIIRGEYLKRVSKILNTKIGTITNIITINEEKEKKEREKRSEQNQEKETKLLKLPKGANADQFLEDRFCEAGNIIYFQSQKTSDFFPGTNHRYIPLFHIDGKQDNKRICEVVNDKGHRRLIDFDSTDLINFTKVREVLIKAGLFFWEPGTSNEHFAMVMKKVMTGFITATELRLLGHQPQGFHAFANGVFTQGSFKPVNEYGIVEVNVEVEESKKSVYRSDINHFYSPSHSEIYKASAEGDDPYENDRFYVYKPAMVSLESWMAKMIKVWGDKGVFAIAMCFAANYRDLFLKHWNYFPLMGGFGQKDSGKSGLGLCIQSFFYNNMDPFDLNIGTLSGLTRRLTRVRNTIAFLEEYRDDIDEEKKQAIKAIWNGTGREKAKGTGGTQTTVDKANSTVYVTGQYWPATDDGAMPSRLIGFNFENKEFSAEEKEEYTTLVSWCKSGITSYATQVIAYRDFVEKNLTKYYSETTKALKESLKGVEYQNRIFDNYVVPLTIVNMLQENFAFPFKYADYFNLTRTAILDNSDMVADSDALTKFWRIVEYLANPEVKVLKEGNDYEIEISPSVDIKENREKVTWPNTNRDYILYLSFSKVHQEYHKEASRRHGEEILSQTVVRNYLKSKKAYFIGLFPARRMGGTTPSGYAFNYSEMMRQGIVSLPSEALKVMQAELDLNPEPRKHKVITNPNNDSQTSLKV